MESEWQTTSLEEAPLKIIDGDRGVNYPHQDEFYKTGHCLFLNAGNVTMNGFRFYDCAFISEKKDQVLRKGKLKRHDVVLTTRGTIGNVAYFDDMVPYDHIRINSGMVILRALPTTLQPRYLYLFVRSPLFREQIRSLRTGSAQPQLPIRDINRIEIPLPPPEEQRAIAHILGTLDDKIELNRRMNETLEGIARAIFKSWFVDFDPVRAKVEGRDTGLPKHIADLFPGRLVDSELGEIPEGWEATNVGQHFRLTMGQSPPGNTYNQIADGLPFYQGRVDFGFRFPLRRVFCTKPTRFAEVGDTLVSVRAPVGDINMAGERCSVGRGVAAIRHCSGSRSFTYYSMHHQRHQFEQFEAEGTVFGAINKKDFELLPFITPSPTISAAFDRSVSTIDKKIEINEQQRSTLESLRDNLLPKLISGKIRIREAETFLESRL